MTKELNLFVTLIDLNNDTETIGFQVTQSEIDKLCGIDWVISDVVGDAHISVLHVSITDDKGEQIKEYDVYDDFVDAVYKHHNDLEYFLDNL